MSEASAARRTPWSRLAWVATLPRMVVAWLLIIAIVNLLIGVFLRYIMVPVTDYFDWPSVEFTWVEEVGELALAWLTLIGAALGVADRIHFAVGVVAQRLSLSGRACLDRILHGLIAVFGVVAAISGVQLTRINSQLTSPGLGINLGWLYVGAVVCGVLITVYSLRIALGFAPHASTSGHGA